MTTILYLLPYLYISAISGLVLRKRFHYFLTQNSTYFTNIMYLCTRNRQLLEINIKQIK